MNTHFGPFRRLVVSLALTALTATLAKADAVYTYTGPLFDNFGTSNFGTVATCPPVCSVSGFIVLESPVDFTDYRLVQVLAFSFTDGNTVMTSSDIPPVFSVFALAGDGFGGISQWAVDIGEGTGPVQIEAINFMGASTDSVGSPSQGFDFVSGQPGVWTLTSVTTPEPPTLLLQVVTMFVVFFIYSFRFPRPRH